MTLVNNYWVFMLR